MRRLIGYFIFLYTALIFSLSLLPSSEVNKLPFSNLWDKLVHTIEYSIWGVLASIFFSSRRSGERVLYIIIVSAVIGAVDETIQGTSIGRSVSFWDFSVDVFGAFLGTILYYFISRLFSKN
jgi:VanZ family protein